MYIAVNRIAVPVGQAQAIIEGFKHAIPGMKRFSGFLGLELWTAEDGTTIHAVSRWTSKEALDEYLKDELFRHHHGGAGSEQMNGPNQVTYYSAEVLS